mgnify:CR=1 FL=1
MPKEVFGADYVFLRKNEWLRFSELDELAAAFVQLGVRKIRLTGGEPLLRPGLAKYIHELKHLHKVEVIAMTTNGQRLAERVGELKETLETIQREFPIEPVNISSSQEVAKRYRYRDGSAEFGLITSVTQPFCGGCTRARISADGKLYTCLFASTGLDLKQIMRAPNYDKAQLYDQLAGHWGARKDRYSEQRTRGIQSKDKVEMSYIGG